VGGETAQLNVAKTRAKDTGGSKKNRNWVMGGSAKDKDQNPTPGNRGGGLKEKEILMFAFGGRATSQRRGPK